MYTKKRSAKIRKIAIGILNLLKDFFTFLFNMAIGFLNLIESIFE